MELSSSISDINLAEFVQQICGQRLTGLLRARSIKGRSLFVELAEGDITVAARGEGRRMRLGDLLLARGRINQEQLEDALKAQRFHGRRFGEVLVELGYCDDNDIKECVRFQIEEEISELLTWEEGVVEFKEGERLDEAPEQGHITTKLNIDASALMLEAARRAEKWKGVAQLVPSTSCVFRLTQHGQKLRDAATRGGRKLLDLIDEGHNVEGIISRTFVGRFGVMKALSELIQSGAVLEVPRAELSEFAEDLKKQNRYEQAIGAFNRLIEVSPDPRLKPEIQREIAECEEALAAIAATQRIEKTRVVGPRPDQAAASIAKGLVWRPVTAVLVLILVVLAGIAMFAVPKLRRMVLPENLAAYREAKVLSGRLVTEGDYRGARQVWLKYLADHPGGQGSEFARGDLDTVEKAFDDLVTKDLKRAGKLESELGFAKAIAAYEEVIEKYPEYTELGDVRNRLAGAKAKQAELLKRLTEKELGERLVVAENLEKEDRLSDAVKMYREIARSDGPAGERARAAVSRLDERSSRVLSLFETGLAHEKKAEYSLALSSYQEAVDEWPGSKWGRRARVSIFNIKRRQRAARLLFEEAQRLEKLGKDEDALRKYLIVAKNYAGFEQAGPSRERMNALTGVSKKAGEALRKAQAKERAGDLDGAFEDYRKALRLYGGSSSARKVKLPVVILSVPAGAEVFRGTDSLGRTPLELKLGAFEQGEFALKLSGFEDHSMKYSRARRRGLVAHMRKKPIFTAQLGLRVSGAALAAGSRIYVPAERSVVALRRFSGKEVWRRELLKAEGLPEELGVGGRLTSAKDPAYWDIRGMPAATGNVLYVAARDGKLHVLDATTGEPGETVALNGRVDSGVELVTSGLLAGKTFGYAADWKGSFLGLDLASGGALRWTRPIGSPVIHAGAVSGKIICYGTADGKLSAFNIETGLSAWTKQTTGKILTAPSAWGDLIAAYSEGDGLYVVTAGGTERAHLKLPARGEAWVVAGEGVVALAQESGRLRAYSSKNLKEVWESSVDAAVSAAPASTGGRLYLGTRGGTVYCFSAKDGSVVWQFPAGSPVTSPMAINEGGLYFGTEKGAFFALEIE